MSSASSPSSPKSTAKNEGGAISNVMNQNNESHLHRRRRQQQQNESSSSFDGFLTSKLLLRIIGVLLFLCVLSSLYLGSYYHVHHQDYAKATEMKQKKDYFIRRGDKATTAITISEEESKTITETDSKEPSAIHETVVFESIIERVKWTEEQCNSVPEHNVDTLTTSLKKATDLPPLPEGGVAAALKKWLDSENAKEQSETTTNNNNDNDVYPICYLPPPKSCDVTSYTLVIMSHTT